MICPAEMYVNPPLSSPYEVVIPAKLVPAKVGMPISNIHPQNLFAGLSLNRQSKIENDFVILSTFEGPPQ